MYTNGTFFLAFDYGIILMFQRGNFVKGGLDGITKKNRRIKKGNTE